MTFNYKNLENKINWYHTEIKHRKKVSNYSTIAKHYISLPVIFKKPIQLTVVKENDNNRNRTFDWLHKFHNKPTPEMRPFRENKRYLLKFCILLIQYDACQTRTDYSPWWSDVIKMKFKCFLRPIILPLQLLFQIPWQFLYLLSLVQVHHWHHHQSLQPIKFILCVFNNVGDE